MKQVLLNSYRLLEYNIKIIFKERFMYFMLSALAFYILTVVVSMFSNKEITAATGFNMLFVPGILFIFYPTCFGIQNDQDCKIIEILFGIPNYRYKIWLTRLLLSCVVCFGALYLLSIITNLFIVEINPLEMAVEVLFPTLFFGMLSFMLSTIIRNGNGTAVVIIIIGLILYVYGMNLGNSKWNILFNPFEIPANTNPLIFALTYRDNRIIIALASILMLLIGLTKTQQRERFI
ncbi:MAG: hypothetical protein ACRDDZ_02155 [Marinifilaceae bacterium]